MIKIHIGFICAVSILRISLHASAYYAATNGSDSAAGTLTAPFQTIQHAFTAAAAGDVICLRGGIYRETVTLVAKSGRNGSPITLTSYNGETAVISGLETVTLSWRATDTPGLYAADVTDGGFEQLFYRGKPMLEARWPNVSADTNGDWNFFSPDVWADVDADGNSYGTVKDSHLAAAGWDANGAAAVLNVSHQFTTWTRFVEGHTAGSAVFHYPKDFGKSAGDGDETGAKMDFNDDRYYLVGKKAFLDAPGEWFFDSGEGRLYFMTPDGAAPRVGPVEIKRRAWGISADAASSNIVVDGIHFFGTAFRFGGDIKKKSAGIVVRNCSITYSSWTEFLSLPKGDPRAERENERPTLYADSSRIENNVFAYGALSAVYIIGFDNIIENNLIHDFNLSSSLGCPPLDVNRNWKIDTGLAGRAVIRFNTIHDSGGILLRPMNVSNDVYMNHLYGAFRACRGGNKDVAMLYFPGGSMQYGSRAHHNWIHDGRVGQAQKWNGGLGMRGDDASEAIMMDHNVIWNTGSAGIMLKNPADPTPDMANAVDNNTIFRHSALNEVKSAIILQTGRNANRYSVVRNNLADSLFGNWNAKPLGPVRANERNLIGTDPEPLLEHPAWYDFRPKADAAALIIGRGVPIRFPACTCAGDTGNADTPADIGAYGRSAAVYWIPGRRDRKAGFPIVPDNAIDVPVNLDVLMWRPAYRAVSHSVYFGASMRAWERAAVFEGERNVFTLPALSPGITYFWRVDAVMPDTAVITGDVWKFTTARN